MDEYAEFVNTFVRGCQTCVRNKPVRHKGYGKLQPLPIPEVPWKSISKDAIVKLPIFNGYDSILLVVDRFSEMVHFIASKESGFDALQLAKLSHLPCSRRTYGYRI